MYSLGIDLGTTFTAAAIWRSGRAEVSPLGSRGAAIPSVVLLREDETMLTGETANRRALTEPHRVAREFKRRLGDTTPILLGGAPYSAESLTARLLRSVIDEVAAREGGQPTSICVCHPANWGPYKTDLLRHAIRIADLAPPVSLITEPEAAAVFYAQQQRVDPGAIVAVYDLGGGTFDAAVLRKSADGFELLGQPEGIERLGGIDFDAAVFSHVARALGGALANLDEDDPTVIAAVARLREECTEAKEALSSDTDATIPVLLPNLATEVRLTRAELESMVRPALQDSIAALRGALRSAGVTPDELHSVLLVGGSSRMPIVAELVGAELGRPVAVDAHPKHAVALGAAWLASGTVGGATEELAGEPTPAQPQAPPAVAPPAPAIAALASSQPATPVEPVVPPALPPTVPPAIAQEPALATPPPPGQPPATPPDDGPAPTEFIAIVPPRGATTPPLGGEEQKESGTNRKRALVGAVVALALAGGGLAVANALTGDGDPGSTAKGNPSDSVSSTPSASNSNEPSASESVPPDERCGKKLRANDRWVCLTGATFDGSTLTVNYRADFAGSTPNIHGGFHLHIYGSDGSTPPEDVMGSQSATQGDWYLEDQRPSVRSVSEPSVRAAIGDFPKICARIATAAHKLVKDNDGGYHTGNCVPLERVGDAAGP